MLLLSAGSSSLGKESSVQEPIQTVSMVNYNRYWLLCTVRVNSNCKRQLT